MNLRRLFSYTRALSAIGRGIIDADRRREMAARISDYAEYDALHHAISREHVAQIVPSGLEDLPSVLEPLLVTTNAGLFVFSGGEWHRLFPVTCFGVAVNGSDIFLGVSAGLHSFVVRGSLDRKSQQWRLCALRVLAKFETRYHNERIHQIAYDPLNDVVLCANTRRTSILTVDPHEGGIVKEEFLFEDATGFPVYTDQSHLNSVTPHGRAVLFAMHNAGDHGSALGFVLDGRVRAYAYPVRGVHDILIHDGALMFTDSFRPDRAETDPNVSGAIRYQGKEYLVEKTDSIPRKLVLRGLAVRDGDLAVGYSFYAKRDARLTETAGGVLTLKGGAPAAIADGPFSQVYDILPMDGNRTDRGGAPCSADELHGMFERGVGPMIYDRIVPRAGTISVLR